MSDLTALDSLLSKLPSGWSSPAIANVARLINGRGFKPHEWETDGLPIIRIQNLNGSTDFNYYSGSYNPKIEVNTGDLLFAWSGSRGTSFGPHFWNGPKGVLNYHTWRVKVDESAISPDFFYHALRFLTRIIEDRAHGASALVHVQKWEMEKFGFPCPNDRAEQQAIAAALSDADGVVAGLERVIAKKRLIKQGAMQDLFTARRRLSGFSGEWDEATISDVAHVDPEALGAGTPKDYAFRYISLEDVNQGVLSGWTDVAFGSAPSRARRILQKNDVLLGTVRPNLKSHMLFDRLGADWVGSTGFAVLRPRPEKCISGYLFELIMSDVIGRQIDEVIAGSNYPAISNSDVRKLKVLLPSVDEQKAIAAVLRDMDAEIQALEFRLVKARAVKEGMMQNLLTGRVRLV